LAVATQNPEAETASTLPQRLAILVSCVLTVALYFTSILVASTVLPQMQGTFSATPDEISWTMTFNILATAIAMPMTGWLVARFGTRTVMVWATGIFTTSTFLCGVAHSLETMILWRIVQGAAGAPCVPLVQTILLATFPPAQHRAVLGIYGMGVVLGPIIGPAMGGFVAESYDWRWAFFLMVPVGLVATVGLRVALRPDTPRGPIHLDWLGFILLSIAIGALQWVLSRGQRLDWLQSLEIQLTLVASALAFYLFVAHSLTSPRPFLDLRLLLNRNYTLGLGLITIFGMLNFTPMVLLPTLMRAHMGYPDLLVGQVVASRGIGGLCGFFAVMFVERLDPRLSVAIGFLLQAISGWWMMQINLDVTPFELMLSGMVQGLSSGLLVVALTLLTFTEIEKPKMPEATAVYHLLRNIGASLFISVSVAEVVHSTGLNYARLTEMVSPYNRVMNDAWLAGFWDLGSGASLARVAGEISRQAALIAYINAFGLYTAVSALAIPLILFVKSPRKQATGR
jgi:DHA2 family multidrug resistance protein